MRNVLQQHGLAGARRRDDKRTLALADRSYNIDDPGGEVLLGWILVFHSEPLIGIQRGQVVEIDLVPRFFGILEIDRIDLEQREITLSFFRRANVAFDCVTGAQTETADLAWRNIDIVWPGQVIRFRRAQESEAVGEHLD